MKVSIKDYKPFKGFYDLRKWKLPVKVFKKLWVIQELLNHYNERRVYFMKYEPVMWQEAQYLSADYQQILFEYRED